MIDEKKLIDTLRTYYDKVLHQNISDDEKLAKHDMLSDVMVEIKGQPKIGGWIPCSERLPEVEQTVLLSLRSLDVSVGFRANTDGYFYTEGEGYVLYENVLAWQPLPEAYHE